MYKCFYNILNDKHLLFLLVREQGPVEQGFAIREKHIAFGENSYLYAINLPKALNVSN